MPCMHHQVWLTDLTCMASCACVVQLAGEDTDCERVAGGQGREVQARLGCFGVCIHLLAGGAPAHSHQALTSYLLHTPLLAI